jgi:hypothetical protein
LNIRAIGIIPHARCAEPIFCNIQHPLELRGIPYKRRKEMESEKVETLQDVLLEKERVKERYISLRRRHEAMIPLLRKQVALSLPGSVLYREGEGQLALLTGKPLY